MFGGWWQVLINVLNSWLTAFGPVPVTGALVPSTPNIASYGNAINFAPGALPTDLFIITGSATKTVRVREFTINGTSTAVMSTTIGVIRRISAAVGGVTIVTATGSHDTLNPAATATVVGYTTTPVPGAAMGTLDASYSLFPTSGGNKESPVISFAPKPQSQAWVLRGVGESLALHQYGITINGQVVTCAVEWTEE